MTKETDKLLAAAERVCWFDWSLNDDDAVLAIDDLRQAIRERRAAIANAKGISQP